MKLLTLTLAHLSAFVSANTSPLSTFPILREFSIQTPEFKTPGTPSDWNVNYDLDTTSPDFASDNFYLEGSDAVRMSVPLYGARTSGTNNPRIELRDKTEFNMSYGYHSLTVSFKLVKIISAAKFDLAQILRVT
jgi:hypothetical protein